MEPEDLSFQFVREITDDFSEERKVGAGAFGVVYKGVTKDGYDVAVKKLVRHKTDLDNKQFRNELDTLTKLNHRNIVKVLGYCYEIEKKIVNFDGSMVSADEIHMALCLEYLHNGSLQKHLSDESYEVKLDWHMRFKIIKGICEGLKYIHKDLEEPICHFDLKPDNILLDKDMVPKIADFGLSRIFGQGIARNTHNPYGTPGYQPPEFVDKGEISGKFDIFSLGAIIMRIVSGPMDYPECSDSLPSHVFIDQVRQIWRNKLQETCSSSDSLLKAYYRQVETCTRIALKCLHKQSEKRPNIVKITEELKEIEIGAGKLPEKGCGSISFSETIVQNNSIEMRKESTDTTVQYQNTDLLSGLSCNKLELIDAPEISIDVVEEFIVGREQEKRKIVSLLERSSEKISVLPIHGIGGIGKTTFSRLIYNDPMFNCYSKAWVYVSYIFDLEKIGESIISQLPKKENQATESLADKKIMIVLDDLWEGKQLKLEDLENMILKLDASKIIILVTTRSESVAEKICRNFQPYKLLHLTNDMCWDIIKQRSDFGAREDKEKLMDIGKKIAKKCAGVALAAQSLGFTLRGMNFDQWMKVKDNDIWKKHNHVLASLMLSYSHMDLCLKPCFTYCAIFPKGHRIVKNDLIYQWISLGFIKPTELLSVMDLCKKNIMQLQGFSFLQESPKNSKVYSEEATVFTMHDLVHDLAISLLGEKFLDTSKLEYTPGRSKDYQYALLRNCSEPLLSFTSVAELIALRFLCWTLETQRPGKIQRGGQQQIISNILRRPYIELRSEAFAPATSLRVLDLSQCYIKKLPDSIGELKELRYLKAPGIRDKDLPVCITKLSHLIFLDLHGSYIKEIPKSIGEMKDLLHLDLSGCRRIRCLPDSFKCLEKLVHLNLSNCSLILGESESLCSLSRLEHLSLSGCSIDGHLARALCGLTELQYLDLSKAIFSGNLRRGQQEVLVRFNKLRYLNIRNFLDRSIGRAKTETFIEAISSLSSLEYLDIGWNKCLHNIPESIGKLRKLGTLDLSQCINLERLPVAISEIDNMKRVQVAGCRRLDKSSLHLYKNVAILPYFVVHSGDSESSSNLCQLEYENPTELQMTRLENVKSTVEAQRIKLVEKQSIQKLALVWTRDANRFVVQDKDVLEQLVPPCNVRQIRLQGYNSAGYPSWMMDIATYLPHLLDVTLEDMPNCTSLPPLGQLPRLRKLRIGRMDGITKIGQDLYGYGVLRERSFPNLMSFSLQKMNRLEEWNTSHSYPSAGAKDGSNKVLANNLVIADCPMLRFKSLSPLLEQTPPLPLGKNMTIIRSGQTIPSSWKCSAKFDSVTSSTAITQLCIERCEAPLHQWSLLRHLPYLRSLIIKNCSDLTCNSTDLLSCLPYLKALYVRDCKSIAALPERLGNLTSLEKLEIISCEGLKALPESIKLLTCLQCLVIDDCPQLVRWCKSEENKMKLAHIEEIVIEEIAASDPLNLSRLAYWDCATPDGQRKNCRCRLEENFVVARQIAMDGDGFDDYAWCHL